jgi:hypothetical protein
MERRASSVEGRPINLFFERRAHPTSQPCSFVAVNAAIRKVWIRTSRVSCGSELRQLVRE